MGGTGGFRQESGDGPEIQKKNESCFVCQAQSNSLAYLIPTAAKLHLYKAAILPHLTYCHLTSHVCRESDQRKLERIQERGLRAIFNEKQSGYEELLVKDNLPSLYNRRIQDILIVMYKVKFKLLPRRIYDLFTLSTSLYIRNADFILPRFSTVTFGKHSLRYTGPKLWNKLSSVARNISSLEKFKLLIRKADLSNILDTDLCKNCKLGNS